MGRNIKDDNVEIWCECVDWTGLRITGFSLFQCPKRNTREHNILETVSVCRQVRGEENSVGLLERDTSITGLVSSF